MAVAVTTVQRWVEQQELLVGVVSCHWVWSCHTGCCPRLEWSTAVLQESAMSETWYENIGVVLVWVHIIKKAVKKGNLILVLVSQLNF